MKKLIILSILMALISFTSIKMIKAEEVVEEPVQEQVEDKSSLAMIFEDNSATIINFMCSAVTAIGSIAAFVKLINTFLKKKLQQAENKVEEARQAYESFKIEAFQKEEEFQKELSNTTLKLEGMVNVMRKEVDEQKKAFEDAFNDLKENINYVNGIKENVESLLQDLQFQTELFKTFLLNSRNTVGDGVARKVSNMVEQYEQSKNEQRN